MIFVVRFVATYVAIIYNLGIVMFLLDKLDLLATKPWFTFDGWLTTAYVTAQYLKMLTSQKICKSTDLISSCLKVHDLGISTLLATSNFLFPLKFPTTIFC